MPQVDLQTAQTIRRWWAEGQIRVAASFQIAGRLSDPVAIDDCPRGELLVTHAGLTAGAWRLLGRPMTAAETVTVLNAAQAPVVWREGGIITGVDDSSAGPIWALATSEVYQSWATFDAQMSRGGGPQFSQAHGHTAAYSWRHHHWYPPMEVYGKRGIATLAVDDRRRVTRTQIGDRVYFGTDPGAGASPATVTTPLQLALETVGDAS